MARFCSIVNSEGLQTLVHLKLTTMPWKLALSDKTAKLFSYLSLHGFCKCHFISTWSNSTIRYALALAFALAHFSTLQCIELVHFIQSF